MKEYIEREYLENMVYYHLCKSNGAEHYAYGVIRGELKTAPVADVREVKHGRWIERPSNPNQVYCSECAMILDGIASGFYYCPNCGTRMDVEDAV